MPKDLYSILGVPRSASEAEIKSAYRRLAKDLHPDLHPGDTQRAEKFKAASSAFAILGDAAQRARYDRGEINEKGEEVHAFRGGGFGGGAGPGAGAGPGGDPFEDFLSSAFGGRRSGARRRTGPVPGRDLRYQVKIAFEDAVLGARRRMTMADGTTLDVEIPPGIRDGQTLRLRSQGQASTSGGPPGDALLSVTVAEHGTWRREGDDLHMGQAITLETAVLGGKVDVATPAGTVALKVPTGSNTGSVLRLKGKGVARPGNPGNLYVRLEIVLADPKDAGLAAYLKDKSS